MKYRVYFTEPAGEELDDAYKWLFERAPEHAVV